MPGISRVGVDIAGGTITGGGQNFVFVEGAPVAVVGDAIVPHGVGLHGIPFMAEGSTLVFIDGIAVCRAGDAANCAHTASGSGFAFAE